MSPADLASLVAAQAKRYRKLARYVAAHQDLQPFVALPKLHLTHRGRYTGDGLYQIPPPYDP